MLWFVDIASWFYKGKFAVGVAQYLIWPETHWYKKVTCTHHLWYTPIMLYVLWRYAPMHGNAFPFGATVVLGLCIEFLLSACSRFFLPSHAWWPVENPKQKHLEDTRRNDKGQIIKLQYLNVNLSYSGWKDTKILKSVFSPNWAAGAPWYQYLPYQCVAWGAANAALCAPFFLLL